MSTQITPRAACGMAIALVMAMTAAPAMAYVGPGAGLTAIGTMIAVIAVVVLAVLGFVWYPLKRMLAKKKTNNEERREHS